jgi:hypothetical protein
MNVFPIFMNVMMSRTKPNLKFKELAAKAGYSGLIYEISAEGLHKFATLIIKECAQFMEDNSGYDQANNAWHPEPEDLLKHFGVDE